MPYKVWVEIEEVDDEGDPINDNNDLSLSLPFSSSAICDTLEEAVQIGTRMHLAVINRRPCHQIKTKGGTRHE